MWYLESNRLISNIHSGFRKNRSTTDHLAKLETDVREVFVHKLHAITVFFDVEKACDK